MQVEVRNFWLNLEKIQNALLKSDEEFSSYLGISHAQFIKQKTALAFLPLNCVFECAEKLNFHFEDLLQENFNTNAILNMVQGSCSLAERYSVAAYSKTRQTANVLDYLEQTRGERAKINLLRKFQLTEDFISQGDHNVNALLLTDITQYLSRTYNFSNSDFLAIGQRTPFISNNILLKEKFSSQKDVHHLIQCLFEECTHLFDKNFTYHITDMVSDYAIIEAAPNKLVLEELEIPQNLLGNEQACLARMGIISSITWYKYRCFAKVEKISSLYDGDTCTRYLFDTSPFKKLSSLADSRMSNLHTIYH